MSLGLKDIMDTDMRCGLQQLPDYDGDDVEDMVCLAFGATWNWGKRKESNLSPEELTSLLQSRTRRNTYCVMFAGSYFNNNNGTHSKRM